MRVYHTVKHVCEKIQVLITMSHLAWLALSRVGRGESSQYRPVTHIYVYVYIYVCNIHI